MPDLEDVARRALLARAEGPVDLAALQRRIHGVVASRRRRRRLILGAGLVAVLVAAAAVSVATGSDSTTRPPSAVAAPLPDGRPVRAGNLSALIAGRPDTRVGRRLPDGSRYRALGLAGDGIAVGVDERLDPGGNGRWTNLVLLDVPTGRLRPVQQARPSLVTGAAADTAATVWVDAGGPAGSQVRCLAGGGPVRRLTDGPAQIATLRLDRGHAIWSYLSAPSGGDGSTVYVADACRSARPLGVAGIVLALDWPAAYILDGSGGLLRVDAATGDRTPVPLSAASWPTGGPEVAAARADLFAWVTGPTLRVMDRRTGQITTVTDRLPAATGTNGSVRRLTIAGDMVAFSASPNDGDPAQSRGLVYDVRSRTAVPVPGETFVGGPWLMWLDGDHYRVVRLS